jgi:hemolysin activation/secretion protein
MATLTTRTSVSGIVFASTLLTAAMPAIAHAQAATPAAPTREELDIARTQGQPAVSVSQLAIEDRIERGPCPLADPAYASLTVNFARVSFAGLTAVDPAVLDEDWREFAGRDVPIITLCEVRDRAATRLRQLGYLAAVQVPPQRIDKGGEVRMDVLVAKLVEVQLRGNAGSSEKLIADHLAKLTERPWFNANEAERHLLLLGGLPGYDIRLSLRSAGKAPGEVVGDIVVKRRPIELVVGTQNLGSQAAGREGIFASLAINDLFGKGDRTQISIYNTAKFREQTVVQLSTELALNTDGLRLGGGLVIGRSKPTIVGANFKTRTLIGRLELSYPLALTQGRTLKATGGLELSDQAVDFGTTAISNDKLRIAYARLELDMIDKGSMVSRAGYSASEPRWRLGGSLEARQGIAGLGASRGCTPVSNCAPPRTPISNFNGDPSAFVLRFESQMEFRPVPTITIALAPRAQYSSAQLLSYEQFSLGNYTVGRGFDPGFLLGDSGVGSSLELRFGRARPRSANGFAFQPYGFFDAGWSWINDNGLTADPQRLLSAGGGVRARWGDHIDANLAVAVPLEKVGLQTKRGDVRVLFTIFARLVPWDPS